MPSVKKPAVPENRLQCGACGKEIPHSAAIAPQNKDYVIHYCSDDCRQQGERSKSKGESKG
jgi:hypothetical protein